MTKRSLKIAEELGTEREKKNSVVNTPSRSRDQHVQENVARPETRSEELPQQLFSSEEQALEFLVESMVQKLGDSTQEKADMADFLNLLLDTDPMLKEEILSGVNIRKGA